jgi:hypothetical protein
VLLLLAGARLQRCRCRPSLLLPEAAWLPANHLMSRLSCCRCGCNCWGQARSGCLLLPLEVTQALTLLEVQAAPASAASETLLLLLLPLLLSALHLQAQVLQLLQLVPPAPAQLRPAGLL